MSASTAAAKPPANLLVGRGLDLTVLKSILAEVRKEEQNRKWWATTQAILPWAISVVAVSWALGQAFLVYSRPVPHDHFTIAVMRADNTYEPPVERDDLPASKRKILIEYTARHFVEAWENYVWRYNTSNYRFISAVTAGEDLRKQYQDRFEEGMPGNLDEKYGMAVTRDVAAINVVDVPNAPYALDVMMLIKLRKAGSATCQRWRGRMTFKDDDKGIIPIAIQKEYNPMDVIFVSYESSVDPAAPEIAPCG